MIENMDAKLMMSLVATRGETPGADGNWTEYMKAFSGKLYRPDVAPADAPLTEATEPDIDPPKPISTPGQSAGGGPDTPAQKPAEPPKLVITNPLFATEPRKR